MPPKPFPYIKDGILGAGDVPINLYSRPDQGRKEILLRTPGLLQHAALASCTEGRGIYPYQGYLYCVFRRGSQSVVMRVDPITGAAAEVGTITTSFTGPVWLKENVSQLAISDGVTMYIFTPATGLFVANTDPDFPGSSTLDYQDLMGLYAKPNSNQWGFTGINDFGSINALNFYSLESVTGNIAGLISQNREVYVCGAKYATEVWFNYGGDNTSADNPTFARNTTIIPYGCGATGSINNADRTVVNWISDQGQWVMAAGATTYGKISSQMMDDALKAMSTFADARAYSWREGGHTFTAMTFPSGEQTWVYDWTTRTLFKMTSYLEDSSGWGRHRLSCICRLNNELFGLDYANGRVYKVSRDYLDDDGHAIQRVLHSIEFDGGNSDIDFGKMTLLMKMGIGRTGDTIEPQVMYSYSIDSGKNYSSELWRGAGFIGEYKKPCPTWNRNGQSRKRILRFNMTDPVDWEIWGLDMEMGELR